MRVKASVLGHFGKNLNLLNGQTVKTKILTEELENQLGKEQVLRVDTHGGKKTLIKAPFQVIKCLMKSENVIILPAHNGLRIYVPLLNFFRKIFRKRKLHYVVIGGWLASFLEKRKSLKNKLKKFDGIYVETNTMKQDLEAMGFNNIFVMPNCKKLTVLSESELVYPVEEPYKLCTFSRVMREKGIEDAINAVVAVNEQLGRQVFSLDIYGQVDGSQIEWFDNLKEQFPEYIRYGGLVAFDKSVEVLKDYFALLFPTRFYTEGIPGTIIDAYAASIPVISAKWQSFADIVDDNVTGVGYEFLDVEKLIQTLLNIAKNPEIINEKKKACLKKAEEFSPEKALKVILQRIIA